MNRITDYGKLATDITNWIKDYADSNGIKSLVVGVSGGIDSAVVSTLCAMTGLPTHMCIIDIHSNKKHTMRALTHARWVEATYPANTGWQHSNLDKTLESIIVPENVFDRAVANTKSRLRMMHLYNLALAADGVVVGTGNKVEDFGVGYFSKWGDGGCDISPIADLYKTEVRELGKYLGVSEEIIQAVPSDGLYGDCRGDEDVIGATYEELEWAMENTHSIEGMEPFTVVNVSLLTDRQREVAAIYHKLHQKNLHKMLPIPIYKLNL